MTIDEFIQILSWGHIYRALYHFTDGANLPSIAKHGILSKKYASEKGIQIAAYGGNQWSHDADAYKGLGGYVNLCFTQNHPMCHLAHLEGRVPNPRYLPIDPQILKTPEAKITLGVANKAEIALLTVEDGLKQIDHKVLYTRTDWNDADIQQRLRQAEKCEVLVPGMVPINMIQTKL